MYVAATSIVSELARESCVSDQVKFVLDETHIPKTWYNLTADLPKPLPPVLHPGTKQPIGPADLEPEVGGREGQVAAAADDPVALSPSRPAAVECERRRRRLHPPSR